MYLRLKKKWNVFTRYIILGFVILLISLTFYSNSYSPTFEAHGIARNITLYTKFGKLTRNFKQVGTVDIPKISEMFEQVLDEHFSDTNQRNDSFNSSKSTSDDWKRRLPHAIIIGVKKCGTRALLEYLRLHPSIRATGPEPHFFDRYYHLGLDWYRQKMPKSLEGQLTIEKTPRYFVTPEVPERIHRMSNSTKLILVVRNPVTRAISDFTQAVSKGEYNSTVTFRSKAIRRNGEVNSKWSAVNIGLYALHLRRWLDYFPIETIHIVDGGNLIRNPIHELNRVQDFLGLERKITDKSVYWNATRGFPCIVKQNRTPRFRCFKSTKGRHHSYADNFTLTLLHQFYEPHNEMFYAMVNGNFRWQGIEK